MRSLTRLLIGALLASAAVRAHALESVWSRLPAGLPADSLGPALQRIEAAGPRATAAAAAYALGQFHQARGEYQPAAQAFGRAAARLQGFDRAEARYRQGVSLLGERQPDRARAAFEEVIQLSPPHRPLAQLGLAQSFALAGDQDQELNVLRRLLDGPAGEAEPAALERYAALCDREHRASEARAARERLRQRWPRSVEAARLAAQPAAEPAPAEQP